MTHSPGLASGGAQKLPVDISKTHIIGIDAICSIIYIYIYISIASAVLGSSRVTVCPRGKLEAKGTRCPQSIGSCHWYPSSAHCTCYIYVCIIQNNDGM